MLHRLRRRRDRLLAYGLLALLAGGATFYAIQPSTGPTAAGLFPRVRPGMTVAEVEASLGGPPGYYGTKLRCFAVSILRPRGTYIREWSFDDGDIHVFFDRASHRCVDVTLTPTGPRPWHEQFVARLRAMLP